MQSSALDPSSQDGPLSDDQRRHFFMNNLLQIGLKILLIIFPLAVAWGTWVTAEVFGSKHDSKDIQALKDKQESILDDVAHIPVVDERLKFISEQLGEIKSDVRDLKARP